MRRLKKTLALMCIFVLAISAYGCGKKQKITLGTGGTGGNYYAYGNTLAQLLEENTDIDVKVRSTAGSAANLRLLSQGYVDVAIVQSDIMVQAITGSGAFEGKKISGVHAIAGLYTECCQIVVADGSGINSIADLKGKRVSIGAKDSGVVENATQILLANAIKLDDIEVSYLSFADSADAMKNGEIDAFFVTAGAPTSAIVELSNSIDVHLLSLDSRTIAQIKALYDYYSEVTIPAGTYKGQDEDIQTIGVKAVLVARDKLDNDTVEKLMEVLFDKNADIQYATGIGAGLTIEEATKDIPVGFHKGAGNYYEKHGIKVEVKADSKITYGVIAGQD